MQDNDGNIAPIMLGKIFYASQNDPDRVLSQFDREYCGVIERPSDGITCLAIKVPGSARRQFIEVSLIYGVSRGNSDDVHVLRVPPGRWKLRAEELAVIVEDRDLDDWAIRYFDPESEKFYGNDPDYESDMERWLAPINKPEKSKQPATGCLVLFLLPIGLAMSYAGWLVFHV